MYRSQKQLTWCADSNADSTEGRPWEENRDLQYSNAIYGYEKHILCKMAPYIKDSNI